MTPRICVLRIGYVIVGEVIMPLSDQTLELVGLADVMDWARQRSHPRRRYTVCRLDKGFDFVCNCRVCAELRRRYNEWFYSDDA